MTDSAVDLIATGGGFTVVAALAAVFVRAMLRTGAGYGALLDHQAQIIAGLEAKIDALEAEVASLRTMLAES